MLGRRGQVFTLDALVAFLVALMALPAAISLFPRASEVFGVSGTAQLTVPPVKWGWTGTASFDLKVGIEPVVIKINDWKEVAPGKYQATIDVSGNIPKNNAILAAFLKITAGNVIDDVFKSVNYNPPKLTVTVQTSTSSTTPVDTQPFLDKYFVDLTVDPDGNPLLFDKTENDGVKLTITVENPEDPTLLNNSEFVMFTYNRYLMDAVLKVWKADSTGLDFPSPDSTKTLTAYTYPSGATTSGYTPFMAWMLISGINPRGAKLAGHTLTLHYSLGGTITYTVNHMEDDVYDEHLLAFNPSSISSLPDSVDLSMYLTDESGRKMNYLASTVIGGRYTLYVKRYYLASVWVRVKQLPGVNVSASDLFAWNDLQFGSPPQSFSQTFSTNPNLSVKAVFLVGTPDDDADNFDVDVNGTQVWPGGISSTTPNPDFPMVEDLSTLYREKTGSSLSGSVDVTVNGKDLANPPRNMAFSYNLLTLYTYSTHIVLPISALEPTRKDAIADVQKIVEMYGLSPNDPNVRITVSPARGFGNPHTVRIDVKAKAGYAASPTYLQSMAENILAVLNATGVLNYLLAQWEWYQEGKPNDFTTALQNVTNAINSMLPPYLTFDMYIDGKQVVSDGAPTP